MADNDPFTVKLKEVRLSYPHLFQPHASVKDGPKKFRASFLIDPATKVGQENMQRIDAAKRAVEMDTFKRSPFAYKDQRCCYQDGNATLATATGDPIEGYENMYVIKAASDRKPQVVDRQRYPIEEAESSRIIYAGCYVNAVIRFYTVNDKDKGGPGLFAGLQAVQFVGPGQPFGASAIDVEEAFDDLDNGSTGGFGDLMG